MSLRSILALLVVSGSFVLGGCAAEAEKASTTDDNITHDGTLEDTSRLDDVRQIGSISDLKTARLDDAARARIIETYKGGAANPRIDVQPPVFGNAQQPAAGRISVEDMKDVVDGHTIGGSKP